MNQLLIVTCTRAKTDEEFGTKPIFHSLRKQYDSNTNVEFFIFKDNKRGLSECYNEIINNEENRNKTVLFVHDDVVLEDMFLYEKLVNSPYSITGLAGAKTFNKASERLAWHLSASREDYVGEVAHVTPEKGVWTTVFGPTNSRALVLDGLFLSCKVNDIKEKNLTFDEDFNFHFYDLALCLRANEQKITCGVLPIRAVHFGLGDSMLTNDWEEANSKFKEKYCK